MVSARCNRENLHNLGADGVPEEITLSCERLLGQLPGLIELLRSHIKIRLGSGDAFVDPRLGSVARSFGLILKRLDPCLHFRLGLIKPGLGLILRRLELLLRVFDVFLNCRAGSRRSPA